MSRLKRGSAEDIDSAVDLDKMVVVMDAVQLVFEQHDLNGDEAVWAAALSFLATYDATDSFADAEHLGVAARALLKEAVEVFESLPSPDGEESEQDEGDEEEEGEDDAEEANDAGE